MLNKYLNGMLLAIILALNSSMALAVSYPGNNGSGFRTQYVGIVFIDGIRHDMADSVKTLGKYSLKDNVTLDPFWNSRPFITVDCHANILCGYDGDGFTVRGPSANNIGCGNVNIVCNRHPGPNIFELARNVFSLPDTAVWSFAGKAYVNTWSTQSNHLFFGSGPKPLGTTVPPTGELAPKRTTITAGYHGTPDITPYYGSDVFEGPDTLIYHVAKDTLSRYHPKLFMINLSEYDAFTHGVDTYPFGAGSDAADTTAYWARADTVAYTAFAIVDSLWTWIQADTAYANKTTLFVTTDHGRHTNGLSSGNDADGDESGPINHTHWDTNSSPADTSFSTACDGCKRGFLRIYTPDRVFRYQGGEYGHFNIAPTVCKILGIPEAIQYTDRFGRTDFYYWESTMEPWMSNVFYAPLFRKYSTSSNNSSELTKLRIALTDSLDERYTYSDVDSIFQISSGLIITGENKYILNIAPTQSQKRPVYTIYAISLSATGRDVSGADTVAVTDSIAVFLSRSSDSLTVDPYDFAWGPRTIHSTPQSLMMNATSATNNIAIWRAHINNYSWNQDLASALGTGDPIFKLIQFNPPLTYYAPDSSLHVQIHALLNDPSSKVLKDSLTVKAFISSGAINPLDLTRWSAWSNNKSLGVIHGSNMNFFDFQGTPKGN